MEKEVEELSPAKSIAIVYGAYALMWVGISAYEKRDVIKSSVKSFIGKASRVMSSTGAAFKSALVKERTAAPVVPETHVDTVDVELDKLYKANLSNIDG